MHIPIDRSAILRLQELCSRGEGGALTWLEVTRQRIAALDQDGPRLNAILEWNPDAENIAGALDRERAEKGLRGPLHGIPVLLKDNIDTGDGMHTSAGSLALAGRFAPRDACVAGRLRAAGAVLCGKTNMTELANFMTEDMPNGYSSRGGQVRHAWRAGADPLGSSTGSAVAVAAGYVPLAVGTETCGSIISPAAANGIVGLKPTVGWVGRSGIIPIAPSQDTAGPMARTVADCALAFAAMAGFDPADPATGLSLGLTVPDLAVCRKYASGLKGVKLGVFTLDDEGKPAQSPVFQEALRLLESLGAEIVPFTLPSCREQDVLTVLWHEFRPAMDAALRESIGSSARTMTEIAAYNTAHADDCLRYGQTHIDRALALPRPMLTADYIQTRAAARRVLAELRESFTRLGLEAVISPHCLIAFPFTGSPSLTLPVGVDGETGLPVPVVLNGLPFTEDKLLAVGAALEAAIGREFRPDLPERVFSGPF